MLVEDMNEKLWFLCKLFYYNEFNSKVASSLCTPFINNDVKFIQIVNIKTQNFITIYFKERVPFEMRQTKTLGYVPVDDRYTISFIVYL